MGRGAARDASGASGAPSLTAFADTNVLIRHLTGDQPEMVAWATALLAAGEELLLEN